MIKKEAKDSYKSQGKRKTVGKGRPPTFPYAEQSAAKKTAFGEGAVIKVLVATSWYELPYPCLGERSSRRRKIS